MKMGEKDIWDPQGEAAMNKKQTWMYASMGAIILSIASLFLPVLSYKSYQTGITKGYNIFKLINNSELIQNMFTEYHGSFFRDMSDSTVSVCMVLLCIIGVAAIVLAFVGIKSMTKQYESATPFYLAMSGLIGTAIPSVSLLILYLVSKNQYDGTMYLGTYIIVTPIAMVFACLTVTKRHRLSREESAIQREAQKYIRPAGDLPVKQQKGNQYGQ